MTLISVVIPVYKAEDCMHELYRRLKMSLETITQNFEIILVEDCGGDRSWEIIRELAGKDNKVKGIKLSRNFGQHYAITAGLDFAKGDWIIVMDCDLQDQPEEIIKLYNKTREGYDIVLGKRADRKDRFFIKATSKLFYVVFNYLTEQKIDYGIANFGIYAQNVIKHVRNYKEMDRSFGLLVSLVGFSKAEIDVEHAQRLSGKSSYNFSKRLNLAIDHILSHSNKPLMLALKMGFLFSAIALVCAIWLSIRVLFLSDVVSGWTSLIVSLFFLSGLIICVIGMVGIYVGKIYNEVKKRPLYIIDQMTF